MNAYAKLLAECQRLAKLAETDPDAVFNLEVAVGNLVELVRAAGVPGPAYRR
jgi:hypothetical protein